MWVPVDIHKGIKGTIEHTANPGKLEMISAGIPNTLPEGHEDNDVPTCWLLVHTL